MGWQVRNSPETKYAFSGKARAVRWRTGVLALYCFQKDVQIAGIVNGQPSLTWIYASAFCYRWADAAY